MVASADGYGKPKKKKKKKKKGRKKVNKIIRRYLYQRRASPNVSFVLFRGDRGG